MDKLKQAQKYQFWALLVVAIVLPFVGWSMARGMIPLAADRTKVLTDLQKSLAPAGNDDPNNEWKRQADLINAEQEKQKDLAWRTLFARQKPFMVWPKNVNPDPEKMLPRDLQVYRLAYPDEVEARRQIVKPIDEYTPDGLVEYSEDMLPRPDTEWELQAPSPSKIEAAQEDLWLLEAILTAVASVNKDATTPFDAPIRKIEELVLRGGSPRAAPAAAPVAAPPKAPGPNAPPQVAPAPGIDRREHKPGTGSRIADPKIKLDEELGAERQATEVKVPDPAAAGKVPPGPPGGPPGVPPGGPGPAGPPGLPAGGGALGSNHWSGPNINRYCDDQKEWKTRGFSLQVIMDLQSVPDLLVALSNCKGWSINVLRVHEADRKDGDLVAPGGAENAMGGDNRPRPFAGERPDGVKPAGGPGPRPNKRTPLDDENLATVSIVGVIYIFKKPPEAPVTAPPATAPGADGTVAGNPTGAAPAADSSTSGDAPADKPESESEPDEPADESTDAPAGSEKPDAGEKPKPPPESKPAGSK